MYELREHKRKDSIKWAIAFGAIILMAIFIAGLCLQLFATDDKYKPAEWFKPEQNEGEQLDEPINGAVITDGENRGIVMASAKLLNSQYEDYGISTQADTAYSLTATITPSDATNKVVDWSVAWKNPSSTWASGKTVTDYVTVTPTADGALTANAVCKKAFGEQVIITVAVRSDTELNATATVDYEQRVIGIDFAIRNTWSANSTASPVNWSFTYSNLNPTIDFPLCKSSINLQDWVGAFDSASDGACTQSVHYSDYTKSKSYQGITVSVAPTATYINALKSAGYTTKATAETYSVVKSTNSTNAVFSVSDLILDNFISSPLGIDSYSRYTNLRNYLKNNQSQVMLRIKIELIGATEKDTATIYNVKFSSNSLSALATGISLSPNIVF